jgi:hypothetical protein
MSAQELGKGRVCSCKEQEIMPDAGRVDAGMGLGFWKAFRFQAEALYKGGEAQQ